MLVVSEILSQWHFAFHSFWKILGLNFFKYFPALLFSLLLWVPLPSC